MPAVLDQVTITAPDFTTGLAFHDAALGALGMVGALPTSGVHVRLRVDSRVQVEALCAAGIAAGGSARAAPRRWTLYRRGEFGAIVRDPSANLIEAVAPE